MHSTGIMHSITISEHTSQFKDLLSSHAHFVLAATDGGLKSVTPPKSMVGPSCACSTHTHSRQELLLGCAQNL